MNVIVCDRCKCIVKESQCWDWARVGPTRDSAKYDLCAECDSAMVIGIMQWDDQARIEPPAT